MKNASHDVCFLTVKAGTKEGRRKDKRKESGRMMLVSEAVPAFFLLSGILSACQDMMYAPFCLAGAILTGILVILILQVSEALPGVSKIAGVGIYAVSILSFLGFFLYVSQGFLYTVNQIFILWNLRFQTELEQFSVNSGAAPGALIFWCLLSIPLASLILAMVKRRKTGRILGFVIGALLMGFVLGRSQMWMSVLCLLAGIFGTMAFTAGPERRVGIRGIICMIFTAALFLGLVYITGGYEGLDQIAGWRAGAAAWFESFRYGEDTLPKGNLAKAQGLLEGEEETLKLDMEEPQEWYLKGFVGGTYEGTMWKNLQMEAYQGEYEGLLKWLETKGFSVITQFSLYDELTKADEGADVKNVEVRVDNVGAYRKFVYLPASVDDWEASVSEARKDWQVRSKRFFGADEYEFQAVDNAPPADGVSMALWMQDPSKDEEKSYLDAESVYRSFARDYYMEVDDETRALMEETFFSEEGEMDFDDFNDVTARIRRVLRQKTRYTEEPQAVPQGEDFVGWFLNDSKRGNAVHYASAAVLAYRTAGYAARYVEGYHYSPEADQELEEDGNVVTLTNKNAHAWAEIYVSGAGWMPIEVVPGMYTEMYTNQIVEGEPTFQVNSNPSEEGLEVEGSPGGAELPEKTEEHPRLPLRRILSMILFALYLCLFLYLILECQRAVRRMIRKRSEGSKDGQDFVDWYVKEMKKLLLIGKMKGSYDHPMEFAPQIEEKIAGISSEEYIRAVQLLQKVCFGGKELMPGEKHTLDCFLSRFSEALYRQANIWGKLRIRYLGG